MNFSTFLFQVVQVLEDGSEKTNVEVVVQSNMALLTTLQRGGRYRFEVSVVTASGSEESYDGRSLKPPQKVFATSIYKNGFQAYWIADSMAIVSLLKLLKIYFVYYLPFLCIFFKGLRYFILITV